MPSRGPSALRARLARNLKAARADRGYSQERLAEVSGVSRSYIAEVETLNRNVTIDVLARIAEALQLDATELLRPDPSKLLAENASP